MWQDLSLWSILKNPNMSMLVKFIGEFFKRNLFHFCTYFQEKSLMFYLGESTYYSKMIKTNTGLKAKLY